MNRVGNFKRRAYRCKYCTKVDRRSRIEGHILKEHVPMDRAPFVCTLCCFRCQDQQAFLKHLTQYTRHVTEEKRSGKPDYTKVLRRAKDPYHVTEGDMVALSPEESAQWCDRNRYQMEDMEEDDNETVFTEDGSMVPLWLVKPIPVSTKSHTRELPRFERSGQIYTAAKACGIAVTPRLSAPLDTPASQIFTASKSCGIAVTPQLSAPLDTSASQIYTAAKACGIAATPQLSAPLNTSAIPDSWFAVDYEQGVAEGPALCLQTTLSAQSTNAQMMSSEVAEDNSFQPLCPSVGFGSLTRYSASLSTPVLDEKESPFLDFLGDSRPMTPVALKRPLPVPFAESSGSRHKVQRIEASTQCSPSPTCQCNAANVLRSLSSAMDEQLKVSLSTQRSVAKLVEVSLSTQRSMATLVEEASKILKQLGGIQETLAKERRSKSSGKYQSYKDAGH
ncbi:hypothetical protein DPMN_105967 [Dreissena polymorpha]|uniref:Uncharacterized protein n=1 Tax=Dreissena polymorpha TaxID=45954 RepID=A0A9D4K484_DREPO|nr:hypothetical protein DPMN_105967 [Dreissena polymorpha]